MHTYNIVQKGQPLDKASKALILLHGRGSNAEDILQLGDEFCDDRYYIAAPQATNNTWYPFSFMEEEKLNEPWISSAVAVVKKLIDATAKYIPKDQIYLMGFSQGACLTLETSARYAAKYGGVVAFSGGLIGSTVDDKKYHGDFAGTKVFIGNSDNDPHVPLIRCEQSKDLMEELGAQVTLKVYKGMAHIISNEEIDWVRKNIFGLR